MTRPVEIALALLVAAVATGACGSAAPPPPKAAAGPPKVACEKATECPAGGACVDGACREPMCAADGDCGGDMFCLEGSCIARECKDNLGCLGSDQRAGTRDDRSCLIGVCVPIACPRDGDRCPPPTKERCSGSVECGPGRLCFDGGCTSAECATEKDCGGRLCVGGLCFDRECGGGTSCAAGKSCVNGLCMPAARLAG
jgi:hypothetical protein